jgi:hypothetical protein
MISRSKDQINCNYPACTQIYKKLKLNYAQLILAPKTVEIKTIMKWKVKYGIFKFPVTYPYILNLKQILGWIVPSINKL